MAVAARKQENPYATPDSRADELFAPLLKSRGIAIVQRMLIWAAITLIVALVGIGNIFADVSRPLTMAILLMGFALSASTGLFLVGQCAQGSVTVRPRCMRSLTFALTGLVALIACAMGVFAMGSWIAGQRAPRLFEWFVEAVFFLFLYAALLSAIFRVSFGSGTVRFCVTATAGMLTVLVMPITYHYVTNWAVADELKVTLLYLAVLLFQGFGIAGMLTGLVTREKSQNISEPRTPKD